MKSKPTGQMKSTVKSTKPEYATILKRDFDEAVKHPWSVNTCILAQAAIRQGLVAYGEPDVWGLADDDKARGVMNRFDDAHHWKPSTKALAKIRSGLPIKIHLS